MLQLLTRGERGREDILLPDAPVPVRKELPVASLPPLNSRADVAEKLE